MSERRGEEKKTQELLEQAGRYAANGFQGCPWCGPEHDKEFETSEPIEDNEEHMIYRCLTCHREWREVFFRKGVNLSRGEDDATYINLYL